MQIEIAEPNHGRWDTRTMDAMAFLRHQQPTTGTPRILFADAKNLVGNLGLQQAFIRHLNIPPSLFGTVCQRLNGYIGHASTIDGNGNVTLHRLWFRFQVKRMILSLLWSRSRGQVSSKHYEWDDLTCFISATAQGVTVVCFDFPDDVKSGLLAHGPPPPNHSAHEKLGHIMQTIVQETVKWYDHCTWLVRDVVRKIEKNRSVLQYAETDFPIMHDLARHGIHNTEVLAVAIDTMMELMRHTESMAPGWKNLTPDDDSPGPGFWLNVLKNTRHRSEALEKRFTNEINLAFNQVIQRDSATMKQISHATQRDSASMKTISFVTLAFLPATFVSTIFSMSFFSMSGVSSSGKPQWTMSNEFWIYWAIAIPLTLLTLAIWGTRQGNIVEMLSKWFKR